MVDGKLFEEIPLSVNTGHNEDILVESKEGHLSVRNIQWKSSGDRFNL